jgi:hypothetical protein
MASIELWYRVADRDVLVGAHQAALHLVGDRLVHQDAARARAALARGADRAEQDGRQRHVEVGVLHQHAGGVATQLEDRAAQAPADLLGHRLAHLGRAREGHQRQALVPQHALPHLAARADGQRRQRAEALGLEHRPAHVGQADGAQRRLRGRLPQHRVAAHEGQHRVPGPHRHREVEGRDAAHHAQRVPLLAHRVPGPLRVHREPVQHARLPHREVGDVDRLLHLAQPLLQDLAHLERDQLAQRLLVRAQALADLAHDFAARGRRQGAPALERLVGGRDDLLVLLGGGLVDARDQIARGRVAALEHGPGALEPLPAVRAGVVAFDAELAEEVEVGGHSGVS